jgi:hypothetical protein
MTAVQLKQSELEDSIGTLTQLHESEIDALLRRFVEGCNSALANSGLTLHRKFSLIEHGLVRLVRHADRTRRLLKRDADKILRRKHAR